MAKIVVKSAKFGIVVKELDTANYQDGADLVRDLLQAIPDADWFEEKLDDNPNGTGAKEKVTAKPVLIRAYLGT